MIFKKLILKFSRVIILMTWVNLKILNFDNILIDEKSHEKILIYNVLCKTLIDSNPLRIKFDKIGGFIRVYDGTRHLE